MEPNGWWPLFGLDLVIFSVRSRCRSGMHTKGLRWWNYLKTPFCYCMTHPTYYSLAICCQKVFSASTFTCREETKKKVKKKKRQEETKEEKKSADFRWWRRLFTEVREKRLHTFYWEEDISALGFGFHVMGL